MDATETVGTWIGLGFAMAALLMLVGMVAFDELAGWLRKRRERPKHYRVSVPSSAQGIDHE